jgi:hypothetical protein
MTSIGWRGRPWPVTSSSAVRRSHVAELGFPFVEVAPDGSCVVTKPRGTGGCVTELTVKEQLVYEIGDPANYLSPDVTVSFLPLHVDDLGGDRVRVSGARGRPASKDYKVSATYRDGFRSAGTLTIVGRQAVRKATEPRQPAFLPSRRMRARKRCSASRWKPNRTT